MQVYSNLIVVACMVLAGPSSALSQDGRSVEVKMGKGQNDLGKNQINGALEVIAAYFQQGNRNDFNAWKASLSPLSYCLDNEEKLGRKFDRWRICGIFDNGPLKSCEVESITRHEGMLNGTQHVYYLCLIRLTDDSKNSKPPGFDPSIRMQLENKEKYTALYLVPEKSGSLKVGILQPGQ